MTLQEQELMNKVDELKKQIQDQEVEIGLLKTTNEELTTKLSEYKHKIKKLKKRHKKLKLRLKGFINTLSLINLLNSERVSVSNMLTEYESPVMKENREQGISTYYQRTVNK